MASQLSLAERCAATRCRLGLPRFDLSLSGMPADDGPAYVYQEPGPELSFDPDAEPRRARNGPAIAVLSINATRAGKVRNVRELVSMDTGEILEPARMGIPHVSKAARCEQKRSAFDKLRPEVQRFATFVLKFRNRRRGITPGIGALCQWYAALNGRQPHNVRRYIQPLRKVGILVSDNALGPVWQLAGATSRSTLAEEAEAGARYLRMQWAAVPGPTAKHGGADASDIAEAVADLNTNLAADQSEWAGVLAEQAIAKAWSTSAAEAEHAAQGA